MAPCDDVAIPWLQQNKAKLGSSKDESPKDEKAFAKRGSILGSLTASISEALSSASSQQSAAAPPPPASDVSDSIFSALKRKGSSFSDAIFNSSDGGGRRPSDTPVPPRRMSDLLGPAPRTDDGGKYELVQAILDDMGSKDILPRFKEHDYSDDVIAVMSAKDVDELLETLKMNAGQKIKFRRELKKRGLCQG